MADVASWNCRKRHLGPLRPASSRKSCQQRWLELPIAASRSTWAQISAAPARVRPLRLSRARRDPSGCKLSRRADHARRRERCSGVSLLSRVRPRGSSPTIAGVLPSGRSGRLVPFWPARLHVARCYAGSSHRSSRTSEARRFERLRGSRRSGRVGLGRSNA